MKTLIAAVVLFAVASPSFAGSKTTGEILSNVSKTRSETSMTFARNSRG